MSTKGYKHSEETKRKISLAQKGHPNKGALKQRTNPHKGYRHTEESKRKISLASKERILEKGSQWKGDEAGYQAKHVWARKYLGTPKICWHCLTTTAKKFEWANKSMEYKRDARDWLRLCTRCHISFDRLVNKIMISLHGTAIKGK